MNSVRLWAVEEFKLLQGYVGLDEWGCVSLQLDTELGAEILAQFVSGIGFGRTSRMASQVGGLA